MIKLFSIFAVPALALAATAGIAGEPTRSFTHEGVTYVYAAQPAADGSTVLAGQVLQTGAKFRLVVKSGRVTGQVDRQPVNFSVAGTRGAAHTAVAVANPVRITAAD